MVRLSVLVVALALSYSSSVVAKESGADQRVDPYERVAGLFPKSRVLTIQRGGKSQRVIAPVHRAGKVGFIDRVEEVAPQHSGPIVGFSLWLADPPVDVDAWMRQTAPAPTEVLTLAQVITFEKSPSGKVSVVKGDGFPVERAMRTDCIGDVCAVEAVFQGLSPVTANVPQVAVLLSRDGFASTEIVLLEKELGGLRWVGSARGNAPLPDVSGCSGGTTYEGFRFDGKAKRYLATRKTSCDCAEQCADHGLPAGQHSAVVPLAMLRTP